MREEADVEFAISGTHVADGFQTAAAVYTFEFIPETSALLLVGALGSLALLRRRR